MPLKQGSWRYRIALLLSMGIMVPLGFWVRFYSPAPEWLNDALGSIAYEVFWIVLAVFLFPQTTPFRIAIAIFLITCALELLQLWQVSWLQAARSTSVGRLVLGNTFSWADFPAYAIGSLVGWLGVRSLGRALNLPQKL